MSVLAKSNDQLIHIGNNLLIDVHCQGDLDLAIDRGTSRTDVVSLEPLLIDDEVSFAGDKGLPIKTDIHAA